MALSYRTLREIPYLPDYAQALARWEQTAPIKGREDDVRPLGKRNQDHHRIERDELSGSITIRRGSPLITYRPNGEIVIHGPKWSQKAAEVEIIDEVLGFRGKSMHGTIWIECTPDAPDAVTGWYPLKRQSENVFVRADTTTRTPPVFLNPNFPVTHVVKRKEVKALREKYSPFLTYALAMSKLRREPPDLTKPTYNRMQILDYKEYGEVFGWSQSANRWPLMPNSPAYWNFKTEDADQLAALMRSDDAESNYKAWLWLQPQRTLASEENLTKYVEKVSMMAHPQDVLTPKVHRDGKIKRDRYSWCV